MLLSTLMLACVFYVPSIAAAPGETVILSKVDALGGYQAGRDFPVSFTVIYPGSGLAYVELYYREEGHYSFSKYAPSSNPNGAWTTSPIPFTAPSDGNYEFYCRAFDTSGHSESRKRTAEAVTTVDSQIPETSIDLEGTQGSSGWYLGPVTVLFSATDKGSGIERTEYSVDHSGWVEVQDSRATVSGSGVHSLSYRSIDLAGNAEAAKSVSISIDGVPPSAIFGVSNGAQFNGGKATISWTVVGGASGLASLRVSLDGGAFQSLALTETSITLGNLTNGSHFVVVRSQDLAGNAAESRLDFSMDLNEKSTLADMKSHPFLYLGIVITTFLIVMAAVSLSRRGNKGQNSRP